MKTKTKKLFNILTLAIISTCFFVVFFNYSFASEPLNNTGIVRSGIWYSKDPFFSGDKVRIYTLIFNGSGYDLIGEVAFDDNNKIICRGNFTATSGKTQEVWCDWEATSGAHKISAKIVNPKIAPIGGTVTPIVLENNVSGVSERIVTNAPKEVVVEKPQSGSEVTANSETVASTSSQLEKNISNGLDGVKNTILKILPEKIILDEIPTGDQSEPSTTTETTRQKIDKVVEKIGGETIKKPIMYIIDFLVALYNFIIEDALVLVILISLLVWRVAKYIYGRVMLS